MKTNLLKYYIAAFYLCSTFVAFAQPGTGDSGGTLEGADAPSAPIDDYVWILALAGLALVFLTFKASKKTKNAQLNK